MTFCETLEFLTGLGGVVFIFTAPAFGVIWLVSYHDDRDEHNERLNDSRERKEIRSRQKLRISRIRKMDDEELKAIATAAAKELKKRRLQEEEVVEAGTSSGQRGQLVLGYQQNGGLGE
ncbi:hypothetical protein LTR47_006752 [Exophiala xenobiotica]|nr:hypothetical protein LTR47_006752 [Exophiala xenobiotica]KAK5244136.1 hypothetical protein LTS06_010225 [Exophiala xenobiotica]KAK5363736.1 hypothetical protein LTR11_009164 [Exophiala xenobiotica]KAK5365101.1 hypothetical protein LTS03_009161 [Exophiala xenobiotica]